MERTALYSFLKNTKMLEFNPNQSTSDAANTLIYHPSKNKDYGQPWAPFYTPFDLIIDSSNSILVGNGLVSTKKSVNAMKSYKKRFCSLKDPITLLDISVQAIVPAGKL